MRRWIKSREYKQELRREIKSRDKIRGVRQKKLKIE